MPLHRSRASEWHFWGKWKCTLAKISLNQSFLFICVVFHLVSYKLNSLPSQSCCWWNLSSYNQPARDVDKLKSQLYNTYYNMDKKIAHTHCTDHFTSVSQNTETWDGMQRQIHSFKKKNKPTLHILGQIQPQVSE